MIIPYASGYDLIVIDEAQKINHIGDALKIIVDQIKNIKVIAIGVFFKKLLSTDTVGDITLTFTGKITYEPLSSDKTMWHKIYTFS